MHAAGWAARSARSQVRACRRNAWRWPAVSVAASYPVPAAAIAAEQAALRSIDLLRRQLEQGQISLPSLLTAQQAYLQTSLARVQAEASRLANTVALFQALGGGWWNRVLILAQVEQASRKPAEREWKVQELFDR